MTSSRIVDSLNPRYKVVAGLLIAIGVANILDTALSAWFLNFLGQVSSGQESTSTGEHIDSLQVVMGRIQYPLSGACGIAFLMWLHRAHLNLIIGRLRGLTYTPAQAVWGYIVPLVNLVRPLRAMKELWAGSAYLASGDRARSWKETTSSPVIAWWWLFFLASRVLGRGCAYQLRHAIDVDQFVTVTWFGILADATDIVAAVLATVLVHRVTRMQEEARVRPE
jgi:hypothetical protein